jgi:hypothetical protein
MKAADNNGDLTVNDEEEGVREASQEDPSHVSVDERVAFWIALNQVETRFNGLPKAPRDIGATASIPALGFGEVLFGFRSETNVHSLRSSLVRTSSHELSRGRLRP